MGIVAEEVFPYPTNIVKKCPTDQYEWIYQSRYSLELLWGFMSLCSGRAIWGTGDGYDVIGKRG